MVNSAEPSLACSTYEESGVFYMCLLIILSSYLIYQICHVAYEDLKFILCRIAVFIIFIVEMI